MALTSESKHNTAEVDKYVVTERVFLDADGAVVDESDPRAASLLATPGKEIPFALAKELGLVTAKAPAKKKAPAANKKRAPAQNK